MNIFNKVKDEYFLILFLITIISPIFVNYDPNFGINLDSYYWNKYKYPSISTALLFIIILSIFSIKYLLLQKKFRFLLIGIVFFSALNLTFGLERSLILSAGMLLPFTSYHLTVKYFTRIDYEMKYNALYFVLTAIILVKMFFDVGLYFNVNDAVISMFTNNPYGNSKATYNVLAQQNNMLLTMFFISNKIAIYNYFAYFGFIYYLMIVLSMYNLINKKLPLLSTLMIILSYLIVINTNSRLFIYGIYLSPLLIFWFYISKQRLSLNSHYFIFLLIVIFITIFVGNYHFENINLGHSLMARLHHWQEYFDNFSFIQVIAPFFNEYRQQLRGSLHNELLEIFSFFGLLVFVYMWLLKDLFVQIEDRFKIISYLLMFILIFGMLIQLNITNSYIGILFGSILGLFAKKEKDNG